MKVLVTYATRHHATQGIAERIADTLRQSDLEVTLRPVDQAGDLAAYDAFVIGSAAYMSHWLKEAADFVRRNASLLANRPVWLFSSGPTQAETVDAKGRDAFQAAEPREFAEFRDAINPRDQRVFFGVYDPDAEPAVLAERFMKQFMRIMPAVRTALPAGDFRDWQDIEGWARSIAGELAAVPTRAGAAG